MVERYVRGNEHRLLVVGGRLAAAAKGEQASVTGDGKSTVTELIDAQLNSDPRRGDAEKFPLDIVNLATNTITRREVERQGYTAGSIPPAGKSVLVVRNGNVAIDVTDSVHPEVADMVSARGAHHRFGYRRCGYSRRRYFASLERTRCGHC